VTRNSHEPPDAQFADASRRSWLGSTSPDRDLLLQPVGFSGSKANPDSPATAGLSYSDRPHTHKPPKNAEAGKNFRASPTGAPRPHKSAHRSNFLNRAGLPHSFRLIREWKLACSPDTSKNRENLFSPETGGRAGPSLSFIFLGGPALKSSFAVCLTRRGEFWSRLGKYSE
jgi:hypothetical protein